jgi:hypothetical protein
MLLCEHWRDGSPSLGRAPGPDPIVLEYSYHLDPAVRSVLVPCIPNPSSSGDTFQQSSSLRIVSFAHPYCPGDIRLLLLARTIVRYRSWL